MVFFARAIHYSDIQRFSVLHCIATRTIAEFKKNIEHDEMMSYNRCHFCALCFAFHFGFFFCPFGFVCSNLIALSIPQHPSVRSSRLRAKKNAPSKGFVDDTLNLFSLCIRVEVNSNMHFYPTWFASIFFLFRLSFCFFHFHLNFLGLFNERRDLIYWFPLNTHWEYSEISCESFDLFFRVFVK